MASSVRSITIDRPFLPVEKLDALAPALAREFQEAKPFPHAVVDGLFDPEVLDRILAEFPRAGDIHWDQYAEEPDEQVKLASRSELDIPLFTRLFLYTLNSATFVRFLETVTGIGQLIPDPYFDGGGLHQIQPGGKLLVHVDFNRHNMLELHRRVNVLVYLNHDWKDGYGGHLELWDVGNERCERQILPVFNRMVIFATSDKTWHGHPAPLSCPEGMSRKSVALYYFSTNRPPGEIQGKHSTLWWRRPEDRLGLKRKLRRFLRQITPPLVRDALNRRFSR